MTHTWEDLVPWHYECGMRLCDFCNERAEDHDDADRSLCIEAHQIALSVAPCPNPNCMAGEVCEPCHTCGITLRALCPVHDPESTTKDDPDCVTACDSCAGRGTVANTSGGPTDCEACGGSGVIRHG